MSYYVRLLFFVLVVRPLLAFFMGIRVRGREQLPRRHPFIIIANHSSHLDTAVLLNLFHGRDLKRIRPVAAADYFERNRAVSVLSHALFNILPIERRNVSREHNPLDGMRQALRHGESLIVFPEGTRIASGELGAFHSGIAHVIREFPEVPVLPVYLSNMGRALPKGEFIMVPFICEVLIGAPLSLSGSKEEIMRGLREAVLRLKEGAAW